MPYRVLVYELLYSSVVIEVVLPYLRARVAEVIGRIEREVVVVGRESLLNKLRSANNHLLIDVRFPRISLRRMGPLYACSHKNTNCAIL